MPTGMANTSSAERETPAPANVPRASFKLPAPLIMSDDILDRNVWSPNRRSSSIVANGELRSLNSPRTAAPSGSLLAPQASGGSSLSSPKPATPTRFEDPLLAMPSFRRSGGSTPVDAASAASAVGAATSGTVSPLAASPSFRASAASGNSFSARRSAIDFRRSVPGAAPFSPSAATSPGEALAPARGGPALDPGRRHSLTRGNSDFGNLELTGYATSFAGSESGGPGLDDDEREADPDTSSAAVAAAAALAADAAAKAASAPTPGTAAGLPSRRHSAVVLRSPGGAANLSAVAAASRPGGISPAGRVQMRTSEDEEFMQRLQLNRSSWRERPRGSSQGAGGGLSLGGGAPASSAAGPGEGGLQDQTHAALEQLRGELKSLSMRSIAGSPAAAAAAAVAAAASAGAVPGGVFSAGHGRMSEIQASQLSPSRLALSHYTNGNGAASGGAAPELCPRNLSSAPHVSQVARPHGQAHAAAVAQAEAAMVARVRAPA